ncbi:unnamed protein product [Pleuronectes platessa]|uniref:Uncharacterized protein n=1 Tax=Pleuronectes platessa TaxID=8262 RepID=A0A9N7VP85_PLEPL|nr:unnamed protein product [Pleuronectes platessa]
MSLGSQRAERHSCNRGHGGDDVLDFSNAARLVNVLIFMYAAESIATFSGAPFKQTSAHTPHQPTCLFSLFLIFDSENVSLCFGARCAGGSEIRLELAGIQCLAQRHFSKPGARCWASSSAAAAIHRQLMSLEWSARSSGGDSAEGPVLAAVGGGTRQLLAPGSSEASLTSGLLGRNDYPAPRLRVMLNGGA